MSVTAPQPTHEYHVLEKLAPKRTEAGAPAGSESCMKGAYVLMLEWIAPKPM